MVMLGSGNSSALVGRLELTVGEDEEGVGEASSLGGEDGQVLVGHLHV